MPKPFIFLPDIAIADIAFEARGKTLHELFEAAAQAVFETMADVSTIAPKKTKKISLSASSLDRLLYDFLSEIIFVKDTDSLVFCTANVNVKETSKGCSLTATLTGDTINPETQKLGNDVKAITMHMFTLAKNKDDYTARVVIDI